MPVEINCDDCGSSIDRGEQCYCTACLEAKGDEIGSLETKVNELESEVVDLKNQIADLEE